MSTPNDATLSETGVKKSHEDAKKSRRPRGEGGLREDKRRGLWIATVPRRGMSPRTFYGKTQREALDKRDQWLLDLKTGRIDEGGLSLDAPLPRNPTVGEWMKYWLANEVKPRYDENGERQTGKQPTTYHAYCYTTEGYIYRHSIAHIKLDQLRVGHIETWFNQLRDRKLSTQTCCRALTVLGIAITRAIKRHDVTSITVNPVSIFSIDVRKPRARKKPAPVPSEVQALYEAARGERLELVVHLGLRLGLRKQEIAALRFGDFDLERGRLVIGRRRNRVRGQGVITRGGAKWVDEAEVQEVPLSNLPRWVELLEAHKARTALYAGMCRNTWAGPEPTASWAFLFPNRNGDALDPTEIFRWFKRIAIRAGQPHKTLHQLRHDCASLAIASGMSLWEVKELLRHSSTRVTEQIYGHITGAHESRLYNQVDLALDAMLETPREELSPNGHAASGTA